MDFGTLKPETSTIVTATTADNPTIPWLQVSYETNQARQVTVPASEAKSLHSLLIHGATAADLGVKIRINDGTNDLVPSKDLWATLEKASKTSKVIVKFQAKERTKRSRKPKSDAPAAE